MGNNDVYMFVWDESVASRGPQEVGSCILYFLKKFVTTEHLNYVFSVVVKTEI